MTNLVEPWLLRKRDAKLCHTCMHSIIASKQIRVPVLVNNIAM